MTIIEIKKELYKQKPKAYLDYIRMGIAYYHSFLKFPHDKDYFSEILDVKFEVPVNDMGTADFSPKMEGRLLNRWIVNDR